MDFIIDRTVAGRVCVIIQHIEPVAILIRKGGMNRIRRISACTFDGVDKPRPIQIVLPAVCEGDRPAAAIFIKSNLNIVL